MYMIIAKKVMGKPKNNIKEDFQWIKCNQKILISESSLSYLISNFDFLEIYPFKLIWRIFKYEINSLSEI